MNTLEEVKTPEEYLPAEQRQEVNSALTRFNRLAGELVVTNEDEMNEANDALVQIANKQKGIEQFRLAIVKPFKDHIKKIDEFFKTLGDSFDKPKGTLTTKVLDYREKKAAQERKEKERLEAKAREEERKIREAREAEERRQREEQARINAIKDKDRREKMLKEEEERKKRQAEVDAENARKAEEKAAEIRARETKTKAVDKSATTASGRTTYVKASEFKVVNPDLVPKEFWIVDEKRIGKRVREITETLEVGKVYTDKIPGVSITCTERPSFYSGSEQ